MTRPIPLLLTLVGVLSATGANAQHVLRRGHASPVATHHASPTPANPGPQSYPGSTAASQPVRTYSYSYYTLSPLPARTYVGYGSQDFPFHGSPYGHPYDPWTWPMMSGAYSNGLARYYDPPVK